MFNLPALSTFLTFFALVLVGFLGESLALRLYYRWHGNHHRHHHYSLSKYLYFLIMPLLLILYYVRGLGSSAGAIVLGFAVFGTLAEWIIGFSYHRIVGSRLWTYHRSAITSYTSWLSLPLWGLAGLIFYLFIQIFL